MSRVDEIKSAIYTCSETEFERVIVAVLQRTIFTGLVQTSRTGDRGQDGRTSLATAHLHDGTTVTVACSLTSTKAKMQSDCERCQEEGHEIDKFVFVTPGRTTQGEYLTEQTKDKWKTDLKSYFNWDLEIFTIEYFAALAADYRCEDIVDDLLHVPPPGGDFISAIRREFKLRTDANLQGEVPTIEGVHLNHPDLGRIEELLREQLSVLVTGGPGEGKSGLADSIVRARLSAGQSVLLIDSRQLANETQRKSLSDHVNLNGTLDDAIRRIGKANGCLVVIDQLDSILGTRAQHLLVDLARSSAKVDGVEVVVLSRTLADDDKSRAELTEAGFAELKLTTFSENVARPILEVLGITSWPPLERLPLNLLNLYVVSRIVETGETVDVEKLADEASLWRTYINVMEKHEAAGATTADGNALTAEAIRLARLGLARPDRTIPLDRSPAHAQERLLHWQVIRRRHRLMGEFHHEQLQDFYVALDAFDRGLNTSVSDFAGGLDQHKLSGALVWLDKLYRQEVTVKRAKFLRHYLAESSGLTAHSRIALLSQYLQRDVRVDPDEITGAIWDTIRNQQGLRRHFFASNPHFSWAQVLASHGVFDQPPRPILKEGGSISLPGWDAQFFLIDVAPHEPEVVARHLATLDAAGVDRVYMGRALDAVCKVPPEHVISFIGSIVHLLAKGTYADHMELSHPVYTLVLRLVESGMMDPAFTLYEALTTPKVYENGRNVAHTEDGKMVDLTSDYYQLFSTEVPLLRQHDPLRFARLVETQLERFLKLESFGRPIPRGSLHWRSAIEDTAQDNNRDPREQLLVALRDTLEQLALADSSSLRSYLSRYLEHDLDIFRRLAIHLLAGHPDRFPELVRQVLLDVANPGDLSVHHELFQLLRNGYPTLQTTDKEHVVCLIRAGFDAEWKDKIREYADPNADGDVEEYVARREALWIRDRLFMLKDQLTGEDASFLDSLLDRYGTPDQPDFLFFHTSASFVSNISSLTVEQVQAMKIEELCEYIADWKPQRRASFFEEETAKALGSTIAMAFLQEGMDASLMMPVCSINPGITEGIIDYLHEAANVPTIDWGKWAAVICNLLLDQTISKDRRHEQEGGWVGVRLSIARLLERGLDKATILPAELLQTVKQILTLLACDLDPELREEDLLADSTRNYGTFTKSSNHTRPKALYLRIRYEVYDRKELMSKDTPRELPEDLAVLLEKKLDPTLEPSAAVRCVLGQTLRFLHFLDPEWTRLHIDQIFPEHGDALSDLLFISAWDGFLLESIRFPRPELQSLVQPKVGKALHNLAEGKITTDLDVHKAWASYFLHEYLHGTYLPGTDLAMGSLLEEFYAHAPAKATTQAAWMAWRACAEYPQQFWPRVRCLWQWRVVSLSKLKDTVEFAAELSHFLHIPEEMQAILSIGEIKPLLVDTINLAFAVPWHGFGWVSIEKYLAARVDQEPQDAIEVLRSLVETGPDEYHYLGEEQRRKILETTAANEETRAMTLELIDLFLLKGDSRYSDIYDRYA